jgi:toxin ParE1/3/4
LAAIQEKFEPLRQMPSLGPLREQLAPGLRVIFHGHYAIYYMPREDELVIVRVLHGARDIAAIAEQGGFSESR